MSRRDDVTKLYQPTKAIERVCLGLFGANIILSLISIINVVATKYIVAFLVVIAFLYMALTVLNDGVLWYTAENARRKNNIQEAFKVKLASLETDGYYNNSFSDPEAAYFVNTFESAFFTKEIGEKMLWKAYFKIFVAIVVVFISCRLVPNDNILLIIAQTAFSALVIENAIALILFEQRIKKLYDLAYHELITIGISTNEQKVCLRYFCVEYESIKAHYKIRLDERLFKKMNNELSEDWNKLLKEIKFSEVVA